jgi:DNA-binding LytR/AlgR family response regulator
LEQHPPDLCLVDIDLGPGEKTGIDFAETLRESLPDVPIIYLTSNYTEEFYERTRHTRPSSFMNKELSRFKLQQAIDLALMHPVGAISPGSTRPEVIEMPPVINHSNFFFKIGDVYKSIPVSEVTYFFSDQKLNYARVGQRNFPTSVQLKVLEKEFSSSFARIHKSYLVNVNLIESINPGEGTIVIHGETLPIGQAYRKPFLDHLKLLK